MPGQTLLSFSQRLAQIVPLVQITGKILRLSRVDLNLLFLQSPSPMEAPYEIHRRSCGRPDFGRHSSRPAHKDKGTHSARAANAKFGTRHNCPDTCEEFLGGRTEQA